MNVAVEHVQAQLLTLGVERVILGHVIGEKIRPYLLQAMKPRLTILERGFDSDFYLRQFEDEAQRRRVAQAPLLHYALLGWRTRRAPAAVFDPAFYRRSYLHRPRGMDPLLHHLEMSKAGKSPRNEVEARADRAAWREGAETVLVFHHGRGGGSSRFLDLYEREIENRGRNVLRARAVLNAPTIAVVGDRTFDLSADLPALVDFARERKVSRLLVNHLIDRPRQAADWLRDLGARLGIPYEVVLHDYFMLCPRIDLVTGQGVCCDVAPPEACARCVTDHGSEVRDPDPLTWRRHQLDFLAGAERIIAPSHDLATRMRPHLAKEIEVWEPESDSGFPPERTPRIPAKVPLRVVTLGALNVSKGLRVVRELAHVMDRTRAPLELSVLGPASEPLPGSVTVTGAYHSHDLDRLLTEAAPHLVFLPAIWPESWSFVLTAALKRGLPVVVFDTGAPAARLRRLGRGHVLPLELSMDAGGLLAAFLQMRTGWVEP
ncbi:hypothetical protein [Reyranella sp.]|uniref:hypothetical protein n=1 Tax=Reyranella sp. TaxID=1929291 RepID=UPI003BA98012